MRFRRLFLGLLLAISPPARARDAGRDVVLAGVRAVYWAPPRAEAGPRPVLLFSHGLLGCARQSSFLTEALAAAGYWVFAPEHADSPCAPRPTAGVPAPLLRPDLWTPESYVDRRDDMRALWRALHDAPAFRDRIDFARLGLMGHSLGGYTVLGLGGAWPNWTIPEARAVLAMSPFVQPFGARGSLGAPRIPVMFQGGTWDFFITPFIANEGGAYALARPPKYYVEFDGAGHLAWTDLEPQYHAAILAYARAFLDRYVKGTDGQRALTAVRPEVSRLLHDP